MGNFIRFDRQDIQAIIGLIDEIEPSERTEREEIIYRKACEINGLMVQKEDRQRPEIFIDPATARLTIQFEGQLSEPVGYKNIARLGNLFAVTDYFKDVFPPNVILRFFHVDRAGTVGTRVEKI